MKFDPNNPIVKLCAKGMELEGQASPEDAIRLFEKAWNEATNDFEKFTAAHYIARHQKNVSDKLHWDETALSLALKINDEELKGAFPSLYLNVAKCYEDLKQFDKAMENYQLAFSFTNFLLDDGYGNMVRSGILSGIERTKDRSISSL